jgi:small subunit ribosomal protein S17
MSASQETTAGESERGLQKERIGYVISSKMDKTAVIAVQVQKQHSAYGKYVQRTKRFYAHDEKNECGDGDKVLIVESRPLSKLKRWRVREILEKAK